MHVSSERLLRRADKDLIWVRLYGDGQTWRKRAKYLQREQCGRISRVKREFEKGYTPNWSSEHYNVTRRYLRRPPPPPGVGRGNGGHPTPPYPHCDTAAARAAECRPVYKIRYLRGEEVRGSWYSQELQPIAQPTQYRIERILLRQGKGAHQECLVKWLGWPDALNSWIRSRDAHNVTASKH